jgi:hypothetical protein
MSIRMVTYQVQDGRAEENSSYVQAVMAELDATRPEGVSYSVFLLEDGVTFVHLVDGDSGALQAAEAFQRFTSTLADRQAVAPEAHSATLVGRYAG